MTFDPKKHCEEFRKETKIPIENDDLLLIALTHKGAAYLEGTIRDYEKLEFLGDAIFEQTVSLMLMEELEEFDHSAFSSIRVKLRNQKEMAQAAKKLGITKFIIFSPGAEKHLRDNERIHCDVFESVFAALYLDKGEKAVKKLIRRAMRTRMMSIVNNKTYFDPIGKTCEILQKTFKLEPSFEVVAKRGYDHQPEFEMKIVVGDKEIARAKGNSKIEAKRKASTEYLSSETGKGHCRDLGMEPLG